MKNGLLTSAELNRLAGQVDQELKELSDNQEYALQKGPSGKAASVVPAKQRKVINKPLVNQWKVFGKSISGPPARICAMKMAFSISNGINGGTCKAKTQ